MATSQPTVIHRIWTGQPQRLGFGRPDRSFRPAVASTDTSTETEMFVVRVGQRNQSSSDWADATDREVMELRSFQSKQPQQGLQSSTPPLPPLSPDASPKPTPKLQKKFSISKPDLLEPANGPSPMIQRVKPTTPAKPMANAAVQRNAVNDNHNKSTSQHSKRRGEDKNGMKSLSSAKLRGATKSAGTFLPYLML